MKIIIIEDEPLAAANLSKTILAIRPETKLLANLSSVKESAAWLSNNETPDLMFMDVQLSDGVSLELFDHLQITCPVVFTTSYDEYLLKAFDCNGIDYVLKPINRDKIENAIKKYEQLSQHFQVSASGTSQTQKVNLVLRKRILVKKGNYHQSLKTSDISYFYSENKLTFLKDMNGIRYLTDFTLSELEEVLDEYDFFRANRQFLININSVEKFKSVLKGKILIELNPASDSEVVVSQENAQKFRKWMEQI